jgi:FkbM family methyltransferase
MRGIDAETISGLSPMTALQLLSKCARAVGVKDCAIQVAKRWPFLVRTRLFNGREMYVDLRSAIGRGVFATGKFDMATISPALETLCTGGVFVDVGANIGFYSILAIDRVGPAGQVICFEIDTRPLRALRRTVKYLQLANVRIEELAVADQDGLLHFIPQREYGHNRVNDRGEGRQVCSVRLDTWIRCHPLPRIDLIKIDVEGAELAVINGAREVIGRYKPLIICEASDKTAASFGASVADVVGAFHSLDYGVEWIQGAWEPTILATPRHRSGNTNEHPDLGRRP